MRTRLAFSIVISFVHLAGQFAFAEPPKVIKAVPDNGAVNVSPDLKEMRITFDQPMEKGMSIVGGGESYPKVLDRPNWVDDRTIVVKVKLQPNHDYWLSINNQRFRNFTNRNGEPADPYPIQFRTGAALAAKGREATKAETGSQGPEADKNRRALELLQTAIRDHYSYRDRLSIDWDGLFKSSEESLIAAKTPAAFAKLAAVSLARAKDKHIWFQVCGERSPTYVNPQVPNANYKILPKLVPDFKKHGNIAASGRWNDGIGYIAIAAWDRKKLDIGEPLFEALKGLADTSALIVDVRINGGGDETLAQDFAGCFTSERRLYGKNVYRDAASATGFTNPKERWLEPNAKQPKYAGRVAVLSGPVVMSSCESFLLMMKQVPGTIIVGARSQGSSGNPKPHDLGNGVTVFLPSWKDLTPDGQELEGVGIAPDVEVKASASDFQEDDPVLKTALEKLRAAGMK